MDQGTHTHQTWLDGDVERGPGEPVVADLPRRGTDGRQSRHGPWDRRPVNRLIAAGPDDPAFDNDDGTYRYLAGFWDAFRASASARPM